MIKLTEAERLLILRVKDVIATNEKFFMGGVNGVIYGAVWLGAAKGYIYSSFTDDSVSGHITARLLDIVDSKIKRSIKRSSGKWTFLYD